MSAECGWIGIAVGMAVGTLGWVVGLGNVLWPEHPLWALAVIVAGVSIVSAVMLERNEHRSHRAET